MPRVYSPRPDISAADQLSVCDPNLSKLLDDCNCRKIGEWVEPIIVDGDEDIAVAELWRMEPYGPPFIIISDSENIRWNAFIPAGKGGDGTFHNLEEWLLKIREEKSSSETNRGTNPSSQDGRGSGRSSSQGNEADPVRP